MSSLEPKPWPAWLRIVVSLGVVYHVGAVVLEPLATPPQFFGEPATLPQAARPYYQPYLTALSLDHAYKFFAPNPGESHLMRYDLTFADGRKEVGDEANAFPDARQHWPRLLYHRYFMLTEFLPDGRNFDNWNMPLNAGGAGQGGAAPNGAEQIPLLPQQPPLAQQPVPQDTAVAPSGANNEGESVPAPPDRIEVYSRNIARYLLRKHDAQQVDLWYRVHRLSHPTEILAGRKLTEPDTYRERLQVSYREVKGK